MAKREINENYDKERHEWENAWRKYPNCRDCGAPLRPPLTKVGNYPGTKPRYGHVLPGFCKRCVAKHPTKHAEERQERPILIRVKKCAYCDKRTYPQHDKKEGVLKRVIEKPVTCSTCARKLVLGENLIPIAEKRAKDAEKKERAFQERMAKLREELTKPFEPPRKFWHDSAACKGLYPHFDDYQNPQVRSATRIYKLQFQVCATCPVKNDCFMAARKEEKRRVSAMWNIRGGYAGAERRYVTSAMTEEGVDFDELGY